MYGGRKKGSEAGRQEEEGREKSFVMKGSMEGWRERRRQEQEERRKEEESVK